MAGLADIVRSAVATANSVTSSLQGQVTHAAWVRENAFGRVVYGRKVNGVDVYSENPEAAGIAASRPALVEYQTKTREILGRLVISYAVVTFLHPFEAAPAAPNRREPVDPRDYIGLPNGKTGPIVDVQGFMDAGTSNPFFVQVWLGALQDRGL